MKAHVKIYFDYFEYALDDFIPCEICGKKAVDIMHIIPKSRGGKDVIENLMAGDRECHEENEGVNIDKLQKIHLNFMKHNKP